MRRARLEVNKQWNSVYYAVRSLQGVVQMRFIGVLAGLIAVAVVLGVHPAQAQPRRVEVQERYVDLPGVRLHVLVAGRNERDPVILLHGFGQTAHMWRPLMAELARDHLVIAPDLRGFGASSAPAGGYDKKTMAQDIHNLAEALHLRDHSVVGHDIGFMVAYAYAAQYPKNVDRLVLMEAFLPGIGDWRNITFAHDLWHMHFYGETPLKLVAGRERIYLDHFWNDFAANRQRSVPEADRRLYAAAYAQPGHMRAGMEVFRAFDEDARDFARLAQTKLAMPVLVLGGEKSLGRFPIEQIRQVAERVDGGVIDNAGHWLMEEAPQRTMERIEAFITRDRRR